MKKNWQEIAFLVTCKASSTLAGRLRTLGYKHLLEYPCGIAGWVAEGNPVTQATNLVHVNKEAMGYPLDWRNHRQ